MAWARASPPKRTKVVSNARMVQIGLSKRSHHPWAVHCRDSSSWTSRWRPSVALVGLRRRELRRERERESTQEETGAPVSMHSEQVREGTTAMVARTQLHKHFFHVVRRLGGRLEVRQLVLARIRLPLVSRDDSVLLPILLVRRECNDHVRLAVKFELAHPTFCTLERLEAVAQQNGQMLDESRVSKSDSDSDSSPSCEGCVRTLLYHTRRSRPRRRGSTLAPAPCNVPNRPCPRSQIGSCHRCRPMAPETAGKQHPRL